MDVMQAVLRRFRGLLRSGAMHKARLVLPKIPRVGSLLFPGSNPLRRVSPEEKIVIVGTGAAALALARTLKQRGITRLEFVTRDERFGGKCVHWGCMPSEYFSAYAHVPLAERVANGKAVLGQLATLTAGAFRELGFPIVQGEVREIRDRKLELATGETVPFDRVVLATGSREQPPDVLGETVRAEGFWDLAPGRLLIVTDGNASALSYADAAVDLGHTVTLCVQRSFAFVGGLPSFRYFKTTIAKRGVAIVEGRVVSRKAATVRIEGDESLREEFDAVLYVGAPKLNLPRVNGKEVTIFDLDFSTASIVGHPDVYVLGDASGMLTVTEGELQAARLVDSWIGGERIDGADFDRVPLRLHGHSALALAGPMMSVLRREWREIDFGALGWSVLHRESGKLWYALDESSGYVQAIHICHRQAGDLVAIASALMDLPVTDVRWHSTAVHPSPAEIFHELARDAQARMPATKKAEGSHARDEASSNGIAPRLQLPSMDRFHRSTEFESLFAPHERRMGVIDSDPRTYFAVLLGLKALLGPASGNGSDLPPLTLVRDEGGRYTLAGGERFDYSFDESTSVVSVAYGGRTCLVAVDVDARNDETA